jgi:hypothetical protein
MITPPGKVAEKAPPQSPNVKAQPTAKASEALLLTVG